MDHSRRSIIMEYLAGKFTCREVAEIVTDYLEGAMPWWDQLRFHLHLGLCRGCRNYLKQMKETIHTLGKLPSQAVPEEIRQEMIKRFRNWNRGNRSTP